MCGWRGNNADKRRLVGRISRKHQLIGSRKERFGDDANYVAQGSEWMAMAFSARGNRKRRRRDERRHKGALMGWLSSRYQEKSWPFICEFWKKSW